MLGRVRGTSKASDSRHYAERGIGVCDRWLSFENFLADMGEKPGPEFSLDRRINVNGNYEPSNCRWATQVQQHRNKRSNRLLTWRGETLPTSEWAERVGIERHTIGYRIRHGWSVEAALTTPASFANGGRKAQCESQPQQP